MSKPGFQIQAEGDDATVYIYGGINIEDRRGYQVDADEFVAAVQSIQAGEITVRIATVGGDPVAAGAMYQALVDHPARVRTINDSRAYSAGSMVLQAGDVRISRPLAMTMVHGPGVGSPMGTNAQEHRNTADVLEAHAEMMVTAYTRHGVDESTVRGWISSGKDHYFSAKEALAAKLIDSIQEDVSVAAMMPSEYRIAAMLDEPEPVHHQPAATAAPQPEATTMADKETQAATVTAAANETSDTVASHSRVIQKATAEGIKAEAARRRQITEVFAQFYDADPMNPITALHDACMDDVSCQEINARRKLMDYMGQRTSDPILAKEHYAMESQHNAPPRASQHLGGAMLAGRDQIDKRAEGLTAALRIKSGLDNDRKTYQAEASNEYLSMTLPNIMAQELRAMGHQVGGRNEDIVSRYISMMPIIAAGPSHGTDHLPAILGNIANLSVMKGWDEAKETWPLWTQSGILSNYQTHTRANLASLEAPTRMAENQEWEYAQMKDVKQRITGHFYGKRYGLSVQALANDQLGELRANLAQWGIGGNKVVGDEVFKLLTTAGSGGLGQVMDEDGKVLFHADHGNYIASSAGMIPSEAALNLARSAMMKQVDQNGQRLGIAPRFLLHSSDIWATVHKVLKGQSLTEVVLDSGDATVISGNINTALMMNLTPVEEKRFEGKEWILAADMRTIEVAGVGGPISPTTTLSPISNTPGMTFEMAMQFGVAALDYRGLRYNHGE
jgi:ATP-dependent protease ClpP protease subunit